MRETFADKTLSYVCKFQDYTDLEKTKMKYGFEVLYTIITKTFGLLFISLFLKTIKETITLMLLYMALRLFGHGIHAQKSSHCWVASILCYGAFPLLIKYYTIPKILIICMWLISFVCISLWAPADTPKKPIVNKKKRLFDKITTLLLATILLFITFISSNNLINNSIFFSYIMGTVAICPLTYKIFGIPFNNYKNLN